MNPWLKAIQFSQPLREALCAINGVLLAPEKTEADIYEQGKRDGQKALEEQLRQQHSELLELQNGVLASLRQTIPRIMSDCECSLVALALEAARKLVAGLPISSEMIEANVREALAQVAESTEFNVHLHPQDLELLQRVNSPLLAGASTDKIQFRHAPEVTRGGCLVQTRFGMIDARLETKFELLKQSLQP